jgi:GNAT superfamily N-acetyltransferase
VERFANVSLRPALPGDAAFLEELTLAVRETEPGFRDLNPAERTQLLKQQHALQQMSYRADFPEAFFMLILVDGKPAGRFTVAHRTDEIRIVDLAVHPAWQSKGIGSGLLKNVQAEAARTKAPVRLCAVAGSPAAGFYERLGFTVCGVSDMHLLMEWTAPAA